jgi:uncharacterized membrane protein YbhN (UPF0104 family)
MKRGVLAATGGTIALAVLVLLFVRTVENAPPETFDRLRAARWLPIGLGTLIILVGQVVRGVRLHLLLPKADRIGLVRGGALAGASAFLLQVIPFRGGEVASLALYHRTLGVSWTRSAAVFVLVKVVDSAAILVVGLLGAASLALGRGEAVLADTVLGAAALALLGLAALPAAGTAALRRILPRLPAGSRSRRAAEELVAGLRVALEKPLTYVLALAGALGHLAAHVLGIQTVLSGLGLSVSLGTLAFSVLASVLTAAVIPSPAGTFGSAETGFAGALALDGIPLPLGVAVGAAVHVSITVAAGLAGIPIAWEILVRRRGPGRQA